MCPGRSWFLCPNLLLALLLLPPHNLRADCAQARGGFTGRFGGVAAEVLRLRRNAGQIWAFGRRREAPESAICSASAAESVVLTTIKP